MPGPIKGAIAKIGQVGGLLLAGIGINALFGMLDKTKTFDEFPAIDIIGGNGYGAKLLPSLACLDTDALTTVGATKIGTGRYVDCP